MIILQWPYNLTGSLCFPLGFLFSNFSNFLKILGRCQQWPKRIQKSEKQNVTLIFVG